MKKYSHLWILGALISVSSCEKVDVVPLSNGKSITKCITHRGYVDEQDPRFLENSIAAINEAYNRRADGTEFDVNHTTDGVAFLQHDSTLQKSSRSKPGRTCPLKTPIKDLSSADIFDNCELKNGEKMPTLEDALETLAGRNFIVLLDFKSMPNDLTIGLIKKYYVGRYEKILSMVTFSINLDAAYKLKAKMPNSLFVSGNVFQVGSENGFDGVEVREISDLNISYLQQKGKQISVFDVNEPEEMKHFMSKNVNYITTDNLSGCLGVKP